MTRAPKPSAPQLEALRAILAAGGRVERWPGGFWVPVGTPVVRRTAQGRHYGAHDVPAWSTVVQTIRALEKHGWLRRTHTVPEDWKDPREITEDGVRVARHA